MRPSFVILLVLFAGCVQPARTPPLVTPSETAAVRDANLTFDALAEAYYDELLALNPVQASSIGDNRFNDRYTVSFMPDQRAASLALAREYSDALRGIDPNTLDN